jgi:hypothetical protein
MRLWERVKAWRRKEHMIKGVNRGRCFIKKDSDSTAPTGEAKQATAKAEAKLVEIKVIRADGTEEVIKHG